MKNILPTFGVILLVASLFAMSKPDTAQPTQVIEAQAEETQVEQIPDWTLSIPSIDFSQQMTPIIKQGDELPVPDGHPGYYSEKNGNLFIVGHNHSVFGRLGELPSKIEIYHNNSPSEYSLVGHYTYPVQDISMDEILSYQGVVIMTCAGENTGGSYSHRLVLYYR